MIKQLTNNLRIVVKKQLDCIYIDTEKRYWFFFWHIHDRIEICLEVDHMSKYISYPRVSRVQAHTSPYFWNSEVWPLETFDIQVRINNLIKDINKENAEQRLIKNKIDSI